MGCEFVELEVLGPTWICSRGRNSRAKCFYCGLKSSLQCDFPVDKKIRKSGRCDKHICLNCSNHIGDDLDHCKQHTEPRIGKITIGNHRLGDKGIYIGRAMVPYGLKESPLANPWKVQHRTKEEAEKVLGNYKKYLWDQIKKQGAAYKELARIRDLLVAGQDVVLVCWCKIQGKGDCHGDVVKAALEWLVKEKNG